MNLQVLYEDNHLIAVNKPGGILVHGDITDDTTLQDYVKDYVKVRYQKPGEVFLGVIHRLDRPVSGVLILARTSKGLSRMNDVFKKREIQKTYWAVVENIPNPLSGTLKHFIGKDKNKNVARAYRQMSHRAERNNAKAAELSYKLLSKINDHHLLEVKPVTGRPHQIRVQLSDAGMPIRGDVKYGYPRANRNKNIHLHCRSLSFMHPVKKEPITIEADIPDDDIWNIFYSYQEEQRI